MVWGGGSRICATEQSFIPDILAGNPKREKKIGRERRQKRGALDARFAIILKERRDQFDKTTGFDQHASCSQTKRADSRS